MQYLFGFLISIAILCTILLARGIYETFCLDVSFSVLGKGEKVLRVLFFSDLHAGLYHIPSKKLEKAIQSASADVILFAGDLADSNRDKVKAKAIMDFIASSALKTGTPFYAVPGNHDRDETGQIVSIPAVTMLINQSRIIRAADQSEWVVAGLDDLRTGDPSYETAHDAGFLPKVILAHNPDTIFTLPQFDPAGTAFAQSPKAMDRIRSLRDSHNTKGTRSENETSPCPPPVFLLSGHFHGGQIWMPFDIEYKLLRRELMGKFHYRQGPYRVGGITGYITRGLGCVVVPLRLFSIPEISFLELRSE